jgi:putative ABC transport system permease protein
VRYQARAAAALAAVTLGVGIAVTVVVLAQANVAPSDQGNLSDRQLIVSVGDTRTSPVAELSADALDALDARADAVTATLGAAAVFPLDVAMDPGPQPGTTRQASVVGPDGREPVSVVRPIDHGFRGLGYAYVATPELLAHYGIELAATDDTTELLTSLPGDVQLLDAAAPPERGAAATPDAVRRADLPRYSSAPDSLITPGAMARHGWVAARAGWFVETAEPLTSSQIAAARQAAASVGLTIEVRDAQDGMARLRTIATTIGALLALAIVAMTIGLIRSESARDLRTLTATGASGRTRRALTATTAGALAVLGAVLGTVGAYVALVAAYHADLARLVPIPVVDLVALVVGLPIVAAAAGWLLGGREPKRFARQALD